MLEIRGRADGLQQGQPIHVGHIPVRHDELETTALQLLQGNRPVLSLVHVGVAQLLEEVADNTTHRGKVIHYQKSHFGISHQLLR
ncbi:hypothetical protein SDC9_145980 [bioreactor metagenome]|uniref:Uncharacterized protein n=1 Tax=bioreactor metagenome TaxID=1076179 RepID=A0A645EAG6_9ZZZZ